MSKRVFPIERVRAAIDQLFASDRELGEVLEEVTCLGAHLLMQTAFAAEVTEFLGRERYVRGERAHEGSRNSHCPTTLETTSGLFRFERPKLRHTDEQFASRLLGVGVCRTNALESLVTARCTRPGPRRMTSVESINTPSSPPSPSAITPHCGGWRSSGRWDESGSRGRGPAAPG